VSNVGGRAGKETVELYTRDLYASLTPPLKRLRGFTKASLKPGETKTISFELTEHDLAFVNADSRTVIEPGRFELMIQDLSVTLSYEK